MCPGSSLKALRSPKRTGSNQGAALAPRERRCLDGPSVRIQPGCPGVSSQADSILPAGRWPGDRGAVLCRCVLRLLSRHTAELDGLPCPPAGEGRNGTIAVPGPRRMDAFSVRMAAVNPCVGRGKNNLSGVGILRDFPLTSTGGGARSILNVEGEAFVINALHRAPSRVRSPRACVSTSGGKIR